MKNSAIQEGDLCAVIDIGSTAIRLVVAEVGKDGAWKVFDRAERPVSLGLDVFSTGTISKKNLRECLQIFESFQELMKGWNIAPEKVKAIATSALREARNRDILIDRVEQRTNFRIQIIEGIEAAHYTYMALKHAFKESWTGFNRNNSLILEVGGGSTEILLLNKGKVSAAHTLGLGTVRMEAQLRTAFGSGSYLAKILKDNLRATVRLMDAEFPLKNIRHFIALGGDAREAARLVGEVKSINHSAIEKNAFSEFVRSLQPLSIHEIVDRLDIPYDKAEPLLPALLILQHFLMATSAANLIVPKVSIRDGVMVTLSQGKDESVDDVLFSQVRASALSLGRKYHYDENHALHVARLSMRLFDETLPEHGLEQRHRLLLEVASILHDIGKFVNQSGHHKHGHYLVQNSEIFGLSPDDIRIVSNVVRYHRKAMPLQSHVSFISLSREHRLVVLKLAAILRAVEALDSSHAQIVKNIQVEKTDTEMIIRSDGIGDVNVEKFRLENKQELFESVFGLRIVLEGV